jgi:hypothetical protein
VTDLELVTRTRYLLNDAGIGSATSARFYTDAVIARALTVAQADICKAMILAPHTPDIIIARLLKTATVTAPGTSLGTAVPNDYWYLLCGYKTPYKFIPKVSARIGDAFVTRPGDYNFIYIKGGYAYGTADVMVYWSVPPAIGLTGSALTLFPDGFYNLVKVLACRELVAQEDRDALDRWNYFNNEFKRKLLSFT